MAVVVYNAIVKSVNICASEKNRDKVAVKLNIKNSSKPLTFGLTYDRIASLFVVCGNAISLNEIKDVPIRVLTIEEEKRKEKVAIGHITSDKWLLFDTDELLGINTIQGYLGTNQIIMKC